MELLSFKNSSNNIPVFQTGLEFCFIPLLVLPHEHTYATQQGVRAVRRDHDCPA
jgi:hypothetical protein